MQDPFVGTWKLNPARSEFDVNHRPSAATMVFDRDAAGHYRMTAQGNKANGESVTEKPQTLIPDGKEYPVPDFPGLAAKATKPDPNTLVAEVHREDGSLVGQGQFVISPDGKTLTATNSGFDSQLRRFEQRTVWERVE